MILGLIVSALSLWLVDLLSTGLSRQLSEFRNPLIPATGLIIVVVLSSTLLVRMTVALAAASIGLGLVLLWAAVAVYSGLSSPAGEGLLPLPGGAIGLVLARAVTSAGPLTLFAAWVGVLISVVSADRQLRAALSTTPRGS